MSLSIPTIPTLQFESQKVSRDKMQSYFNDQLTGISGALILRLVGILGDRPLTFHHPSTVIFAGSYLHSYGNTTADREALANLLTTPSLLASFAKQCSTPLRIIDVGQSGAEIKPQTDHHFSLTNLRVGQTQNMEIGPALSLPEVQDSIWVGMNIASQEIANQHDLLNTGQLGQGSQLAAAAVAATVLNRPIRDFLASDPSTKVESTTNAPLKTSNGRGVLDPVAQQAELIEKAIEKNQPEREDPLDILRCVGGTEIGALAGIYLTSAAGRVPILINDFVTAAAALIATRLAPPLRSYLIASQATDHPGHQIILRHLNLTPILATNIKSGLGEAGLLATETMKQIVNSYTSLVNS